MKQLLIIFQRAKHSKFFLWILNFAMGYAIPFNRPHRIRITSVNDDGVSIRLPFRKKNLNHLKSIHACALATMAEYSSGVSLLTTIGNNFRHIMKKISVTYHYQAKMDVNTTQKLEKK